MSEAIQTQLRAGRVSRKIDRMWVVEIPVSTRESAADYIEKLENRLEKLALVVKELKWKSIDKDNMEFQCTTTCWVMDRLNEALQESSKQ